MALTGTYLISKIKTDFGVTLAPAVERAYATKLQDVINANPTATDTELDTLLVNALLKLSLVKAELVKAFDENGNGKIDTLAELNTSKLELDKAVDIAQDDVANGGGTAPGQTFTLTNGTDAATANVFNAGAVYSPGGNDRINSLQDEDVLTGTAGRTDNKLNLTLANSNDNVAAGSLVTPTLNNIQTIDAAYSNTDGTGLDLQDATGLTNVNITRVAGSALSNARVLNLPDTAVNLSVANSADRSQITLTYRDGDLVGTENVNVALSNVFTAGLTIGGQNNVLSEQVETINLTVNSLSVVEALDTKEDGLAATGQTINLVANANFIGGNDVDDDGNVIEHNNFFTGVAGVNSGTGVSAINVTGAGNVTLGSVGAADDVVGNAIVDAFTLDASAATGNVAANISNSAADAQSSFTTGTGADTMLAGALAVDLNSDGVADAAPVLVNLAADVATNNGDDTVNVSGAMTVTGSILTGEGNDVVAVQGGLAGAVTGGGTINLGAGDDTLVLGRQNLTNAGGFVAVAEEANVLAGDGNDTVILTGATAGDTAGDTEDDLGANVDLGAGDDTVIFDLTNQANIAVTLIDGTLVGGTGTNTLTVTGNATVGNVANYDPTATPATDAVTGFSTLNLVSEQAYSAGLVTRINTVVANTLAIVQNDAEVEAAVAAANTQTADYTVDASEFTGLTTINLDNQAGVTAAAENNSFAGDAATYTLNNLVGTEAVTLTTVEAATGATATRGVGGVTQAQITADVTADATLNVGLADATPANQTFAATLNGNGDVAINDNAAGQYAQVTLATQTNEIENLNLTIGGDTSRSIILADSHFEGTLTLGGTNTQTITVGAVVAAGNAVNAAAAASASTVTSTLTGSVNLTVSDNEAHTITTAAAGGNDVVNLLNDTLTTADTINLGGGTADRIIINDDIRGLAADTDAVFKTISGVEQLELRGNDGAAGTIDVSLDNDALITGIDTIVVDLDSDGTADGLEANVDLNIDAAFTRALTITMANESTLDIDNKGNGNLNITIAGREGATRTANDAIDTQLDLTDAGTGNVVNITINTANVAQTVSAVATGPQGIVLTNNLTGADASPGDIDRITLVDSDANLGGQTATATNPVTTQAGAITVTGSAQWAQAGDTLVVDASNINDDDGTALDENVAAGFPDVGGNEDTQTVVLNFAGMNYAVNLTGSEMNNGTSTIGVGAVRVLNADVFLNAAFDDVLTGGNVADTISGGAGMDLIQGGTGGDRLTGGTEADTFVFTAAADSNLGNNALDTITDFVSGTDKIRVTLTADGVGVVNASSFALVNNAGGGDNSLAGNNLAAANRVIGDAYFSSGDGQLAIDMDGDGDITTANDLVVSTAAVAATDLQFVINGTGGADVIRGGQGQDDIQAGAGNDTIVLVGSLTAAEAAAYSVAGAGVVNATVGRVLAYNELLSARTATEAVAGEKIDGQGGNDTLEIFGTVDLTGMTLAGIETLSVHSTVTLTQAQYQALTTIVFDGNTPHTLVIRDAAGNDVTNATVAAAGPSWVFTNTGAATTVSFGTTTNMTVAQAQADTNNVIGSSVLTASDVTYASAKAKFAANSTGYTIVDTLAAVTTAIGADGAAAVDAVLAGAANGAVTLTAVSGNVSAPAYTEANVDAYQLATGAAVNTTMNAAQVSKITAAAATADTLTVIDGDYTTFAANAAVENYAFGNDTGSTGANAYSVTGITGAQTVTATEATDTVTVGVTGIFTGNLTGNTADVVSLANGASIAGANSGAAFTGFTGLTVADGGSVTMTRAQHEALNGTITAAGTGVGGETINITTTGAVTARAAIESYVLSGLGNDITVQAGTNVTAGAGADTVIAGTNGLTGNYVGLAATDSITAGNAANIATARFGGVLGAATGAGTIVIADSANVLMTRAQNNAFTTVTATGTGGTANTITVTDAGQITGRDGIETYVLNNAAGNIIMLGDDNTGTAATSAQNVTGAAGFADTVRTGALTTITGNLALGGTGNDVLQIDTTATNISGATTTSVEQISLQNGVSATMTRDQNALISEALGTNVVTISDVSTTIAANAAVESYVLAGAGANTITLTAAGQGVTTAVHASNQTVNTGTLTSITGAFVGNGTSTDILAIATDGTNISTATGLTAAGNWNNITLANNVNATVVAAQYALITTATGTNTVTISDATSALAVGAAQATAGIETIVLGAAATDTATVTTGVGGAFGGTLSLAGGGADTITITNAAIAATDAVSVTISNFNVAGADKVLSLTPSGYQTVTAAATATSIADQGVIEIETTVGELLNTANTGGGAAEALIATALAASNGGTLANGNDITVVMYGAGNAYIYQVDVTAVSADVVHTNIEIELVATLTGVAANSLTSANFA